MNSDVDLPASRLDHLVITAPSLRVGAAFVEKALNVEMETGGEHPTIGTHNMLLRLGEAVYLEVIAPNPAAAAAPQRPRWFELDRLDAGALPELKSWVARTEGIHATSAQAVEPLGTVTPMSRGEMEWLITISPDGMIPLDGVGPALIEWPSGVHPAAMLRDQGLVLAALELVHPDPARVTRLLASICFNGPVLVTSSPAGEPPRLVAHVETRRGRRILSSFE